ncbi:MAG TPA: acyltransferase [Candidatus Avimuribaculum pullicola]|nr:acyltransferase [Candidatus Avimuribaculum pullicola]
MLRAIIKRIVYKLCLLKARKKATFLGKCYKVNLTGKIMLSDGSTSNDIILGDHICLYGQLTSQNKGKIVIGDYTAIGRNCEIRCVESIKIGHHTVLAKEVIVTDNNTHPTSVIYRKLWAEQDEHSEMHLWKYSSHKAVIIGDNVWIGERSRICKGVTIGNNCVIGANSVVTKDVPDNCIAAGNPAKVVKTDIDKLADPTDCVTFNEFIRQYGSYF